MKCINRCQGGKRRPLRWFFHFVYLNTKQLAILICTSQGTKDRDVPLCSIHFNTFVVKKAYKDNIPHPILHRKMDMYRTNLTIMEMARCMLIKNCIPHKYCAEVVCTIVYMLNRSPTKSAPTMTLEKAWFGKNPQVSHLKVFVSIAYMCIINEKCSKLESNCKKLMFTEYSDHHKAYRLIDIEADRCVLSHDIVFDEHTGLFQSTSYQKSIMRFLTQDCDIIEKPLSLLRSTSHEARKTSYNHMTAELSQNQQHIDVESSPIGHEISIDSQLLLVLRA